MFFLITTLIDNVDHSLYKSISIFLISIFSNTFSAISGGGAGLIQLPALVLSGIPYYQALASHKLATVALGIGGSLRNYKSLTNDIFITCQILIFGLPGVIFGASIVEYLSEQYLYFFLGVISILLAFANGSKDKDSFPFSLIPLFNTFSSKEVANEINLRESVLEEPCDFVI